VLTNFDLEKMVQTNDAWIVERTGIHERRIAAPDEPVSALAQRAAEMALADASVAAEDLDLIIMATLTSDRIIPSTACVLQDRLGAERAAAEPGGCGGGPADGEGRGDEDRGSLSGELDDQDEAGEGCVHGRAEERGGPDEGEGGDLRAWPRGCPGQADDGTDASAEGDGGG